jgi:hypothetical protein
MPRPCRLTPGQEIRYPLYRRLDGPPSSTVVKNEYGCNSTPLICIYGGDRDNLNFYLLIISNFTNSFRIYLNNRTYWINYMVLNGMTIVNGEDKKICKPAVMASGVPRNFVRGGGGG